MCIYFALDEIADDLVVEVFDRSPLDTLLHVLLLQRQIRGQVKTLRVKTQDREKKRVEEHYLLSLQSQLNENLLQLLIHKVDAELFESIFLMKREEG